MLQIDLSGKRAFVAGVGDDGGFGFSIAKHLAMAGASVCVGTWPPAYIIFTKMLQRGKMDASLEMPDGGKLGFEKIYPFDGDFDTMDDVPQDVLDNKRYKDRGDFTIQGVADQLVADFGERPVDIVVHSFANGPEVKKPLIDTSRKGYLSAIGSSAYSFVSMVQRFGPLVREGGSFLNLTYLAAERVVPGYGGGMSSAKAALESDTRTLAFDAGRRHGVRVNSISAGPWASRAASAIGFIGKMIDHNEKNSPLPEAISSTEVGATGAFLCSPLAAGITGEVVHVDKGFNVMGAPAEIL
ncbi:MAG: enoyl-[acyl-carrier-protein] reductase [Myxococcales bacterium]|jgi:enoyl-[acyl-carrier protein] reductase I